MGPTAGLKKLFDEMKCLTTAGNQTPDRPARSTVTMLNELSFTVMAKEAQTALFKDPVRTALQTLLISVIKTNQFML